jgi:hypothetical protein
VPFACMYVLCMCVSYEERMHVYLCHLHAASPSAYRLIRQQSYLHVCV